MIDFSETSAQSLKSAVFMAEQLAAPVTVLYPYRLNQIEKIEDMSQTKKNMELAAAEDFKKISSEYLKDSGVVCSFKPEVGFLNDRVYAYSRRNKIGLVVMSKQLVENNKDGFLEMVDQLPAPLLLV
ncbi:MAG TPA: hypothetical protein VFE50_19375 [Cyclobacteriaceae bacterium]|nr:hypothetical protein [Cyclobacteriaceae bacterium]